MITQTIFDNKRNGLFRDRVRDFLIDRLVRTESMAESHYHPYYEFFYVVKGSCRMFVDHSLFILNEGDLVILPPSALHRTQYENEVERITMSITYSYIEDIRHILGDGLFNENVQTGKISFESKGRAELEAVFDEMLFEEKNADGFSEINQKSLVLKFLVILARNLPNRKESEQIAGETEISIQKAARFIFDNFDRDITLEVVSKIAGMRDTYFSRKFQEVTGYGFKEYVTNLRLQKSQELLLNTNLTVTQIALACGFSNSNYFGDAFKKRTGLSPRKFRQSI